MQSKPAELETCERWAIPVPWQAWSRAKRPWRGVVLQWNVATLGTVAAAFIGGMMGAIVVLALGVGLAFAIRSIADRRLRRIEALVLTATPAEAEALRRTLEGRVVVRLFAPHAWLALQHGRLSVQMGDGREAARSFAEAVRLLGPPGRPELERAEARARILAGDLRAALARFEALDSRGVLRPEDGLDYGIALLEAGRVEAAVVQLERAHGITPGKPRLMAALALAHARAGHPDRALECFHAGQAGPGQAGPSDAWTNDLRKRARKALRAELEAERRGARGQPRSGKRTATR